MAHPADRPRVLYSPLLAADCPLLGLVSSVSSTISSCPDLKKTRRCQRDPMISRSCSPKWVYPANPFCSEDATALVSAKKQESEKGVGYMH